MDGWGVDFALLDKAGHLMGNPAHYRDWPTERAFPEVWEQVSPKELFQATGIQLMPISTVHQLWAMRAAGDPALEMASTLLMMPELFHYWLCGIPTWEWTEATATLCYDPLRPVVAAGMPAKMVVVRAPLGAPELLAMAEKAPALRSLVDPNHPAFGAPTKSPSDPTRSGVPRPS